MLHRLFLLTFCFLLVLLAGTGSLLAQDEDESTESDGKSYVLAYVLVFLIMTLGIVLVCRPTKRLDRPKMVEQDLEAKLDQMSGK